MNGTGESAFAVSVIIAVLDGAEVLGTQLDALARQDTDLLWELLVVDNGSRDGTVDLVRRYQDGFPVPLRIIDGSSGRGAAHARNAGALMARSEKLAFCDADDRVGATWVGSAAAGLEEFDVLGGPLRLLEDPFREDAALLPYTSYHQGVKGAVVTSGNMAVGRSLFLSTGGFDEGLPPYGGEDLELSIRLRTRDARFGAHEGLLLYFRPTARVRAKLKKLVMSSAAEVAIWDRHPDQFPDSAGTRGVLRSSSRLPRAVLTCLARRDIGRAVRLIVSWAALVRSHLPGAERYRRPVLVSPSSPLPREIFRS